MTLRAAVVLVAILAGVSYIISAPPLVAPASRTTIVEPSSQLANTATGASTAVSDDVANKQCPKKGVRNGIEYVYRSDKLPRPGEYTENGKKYHNLYSKECEGPMIKAFCSNENFCDAKTFANAECYFEGKWQKCKTPDGVQVAANTGSTATDAPAPISSQMPQAGQTTPPAGSQPTTPTTAGQGINDAYAQTQPPAQSAPPASSPPTAPPAPGTTPPAPSSAQMPQAGTGPGWTPGQTAGLNPYSPGAQPGSTPGFQPIQNPGTYSPGASGFQPRPTGFQPRPTGQPWSPTSYAQATYGQPAANSQPRFSMQSFFNGFLGFVGGIASSFASAPAPQPLYVNVVQPQIIVVKPPQQPQQPLQPGQQQPQQRPPLVRVGTTSVLLIVVPQVAPGGPDGRSVAVNIQNILSQTMPPIAFLEILPRRAGTSTLVLAPERAPAPGFFLEETSTSTAETRRVFIERAALLATSTQVRAPLAASTTVRRVTIVDNLFAISIPDIIDAIGKGSVEFIQDFLARVRPSRPGIAVQQDGAMQPVALRAEPSFPIQGDAAAGLSVTPQAGAQPSADNGRSGSGAGAAAEEFSTVSAAHRVTSGVAVRPPESVFGSPIPVRGAVLEGPLARTFGQLVAENGVRDIRKLFRSLWELLFPSRE